MEEEQEEADDQHAVPGSAAAARRGTALLGSGEELREGSGSVSGAEVWRRKMLMQEKCGIESRITGGGGG